jgi:exoribonuclease-2
LRTIEAKATVVDHKVVEIHEEQANEPKELIADFMIAANGVAARFLDEKRFPSLRRIVREPQRWDRIMRVAEDLGEKLPDSPDAKALEEFLIRRRKADPLRFPDLSLTIVKLLGSGEYAVAVPGSPPVGHFGLAVKDYSHSTAPNRRYPDLITQRLLKAALAGEKSPYTLTELEELAAHCTDQEDEAEKVERQVTKSAAAMLLEGRLGERFEGIVTGASGKGTWVRILHPPVEGKVVKGHKGLDVGDKVNVKLLGTNPERGFIDFARVRK